MHSPQRFQSPSRRISLLLHLAGIASFSASFRFLFQWDTPLAQAYGGHFQYLTIIGLSMALITFVVGLLADLTLSEKLFRFKNGLSVSSAPLEILITILYWGLCAIDKSLLFPPENQLAILPDVGFHAAPGIFLALDLLLLSPPWTIEAANATALSMSFAFLYWFWVEWCASRNNFYPYPIFSLLSTLQRALLFTFSAALMTGSTMALKWIYGRVNGIEKFKQEAVSDPAGVRSKLE